MAVGLDHPSRQPRPRQRRRAEGRRAPGELRLDDRDHGRALFPCAGRKRPRRGQAARRAGAPRDPLPARHAVARSACENFRGFGGAQSYPSRTKDKIPVDFSTGSVGLGVAITLFASLIQDYLTAHGWLDDKDRGRFVALIGDAELDEGNIYEAIIEGAKHDVRNLWWIVDYNRQSLDATSADRMFERFDEIFKSCGWRVVEIRYGKKLQAALDTHPRLKAWFEKLPNADLSALHYQGGAAWRARIDAELGKTAAAFLKDHDDAALAALFTDLGGHCMETLSRRSTPRRTMSPPCSSPGRSRATACPSPATRTIIPA